MHPRTEIRHAVAGLLAANSGTPAEPVYPTGAGPRIYVTRSAPLAPRLMPAALVYTTNEDRDPDAPYATVGDDRVTKRVLTLNIEAAVAGEDADDAVDVLCGEIESTLLADPNLGGRVASLEWQSVVFEPAGDGQQVVLVAGMEWRITYYTVVSYPEGTLPTEVLVNFGEPYGEGAEDDYEPLDQGFQGVEP